MRNKVGDISERRIRTLILTWLAERDLLLDPRIRVEMTGEDLPSTCLLKKNLVMEFSSEPDIAFWRQGDRGRELIAVVEIKGGIDPAGALERYGAATKSFQQSLAESPHCRNFLLSAVYTPELKRRIRDDRLVDKYFDIVSILEDTKTRMEFFNELFHFALRLTD